MLLMCSNAPGFSQSQTFWQNLPGTSAKIPWWCRGLETPKLEGKQDIQKRARQRLLYTNLCSFKAWKVSLLLMYVNVILDKAIFQKGNTECIWTTSFSYAAPFHKTNCLMCATISQSKFKEYEYAPPPYHPPPVTYASLLPPLAWTSTTKSLLAPSTWRKQKARNLHANLNKQS